MFNGDSAISFQSSKSKDEVIKVVEEQLEILGNVSVSSSGGGINISGSKFSGFGYNTVIEGRFSERDGRFSVNIDFKVIPGFIAWAIGICFFPLGFAIMLLPGNAKEKYKEK